MDAQPSHIALITGASRGIGRAIALDLARNGWRIALNYRSDRASAESAAAEIRAHGGTVALLPGDISIGAEACGIVDATVEQLGGIELLVNNAGITADNLLAAMPDEDIMRVLQTNLVGAIFCTQAAVRHLVAQRRGAIVNLSSVAAARPGRGQAVYAAAKGGIESFTRAMAVELAPRHIRVNAVAPGVIDTEMSRAVATAGHSQIMDRLLVKRLGTVDDVARTVRFLADPANSYITGEVINVTGGLKMP